VNQLWDFLNGKKTIIGIMLIYFAGAISCWYDATGWTIPDLAKGFQSVAEYSAYFIGGTGIVHKYNKGEIATTIK
jgi:hypothetical protein